MKMVLGTRSKLKKVKKRIKSAIVTKVGAI